MRIAPDEISKKGRVPKNGNIFFTIFQTFMSTSNGAVRAELIEGHFDEGLRQAQPERVCNFGEYPPDFFDFIIIDECHRGGANDEGNWRGILEYF